MKNSLDRKLSNIYPRCSSKSHYADGSLGIEVELEGDVSACQHQSIPLWGAKADGSLRNGVEYVLVEPTRINKLDLIGETFKQALKGYQPQTSIRTSMHIHVCVASMTLQEVYNAIFAYYMLEELLVAAQPKERQGNLFCLRMSDSRVLSYDLRHSLKSKHYFSHFRQEAHKYAALNLAAVCKYGSLEFRFMQATYDPSEIMKWAKALHELVIIGSKIPASLLLSKYEDMHSFDFVSMLIPSGEWLLKGKSRGEVNQLIHTNYDVIVETMRIMQNHDRFSLPEQLWDSDDLDPEIVNNFVANLQLHNNANPVDELEEAPQIQFDDISEDIIHEEDPNW